MHPKVQVFDGDGNFVDGSAVQFTFGGTGGGDQLGSSSSATVTTDASGFAETPDWTVGSAGTHVLHATIDGVTSDVSVTSAPAHHVSLSIHSLSGMKNGDLLPSIDAAVLTASNDTLLDEVFPIVLAGSPHETGKHIFNSASQSSNNRGKTTFSGLSLDAEAQTGGALVFSVSGESAIAADSVTFDAISAGSPIDVGGSQSSYSVALRGLLSGTNAPSVQLKDHKDRNGVSGMQVAWSLSGCDGIISLAGTTSNSDATGKAVSPDITGIGIGSCSLTAKAPSLSPTSFTIAVTP